MTQAVIFDLFGVVITDALEGIVAELQDSEPEKAARIVDTIARANKGLMSPEESRSIVAGLLGITTDAYVDRIRNGEIKNRQLLGYIGGLRPTYKTGLLSNTSKTGIEVRFTPEELATYFDAVVASGAVGYAKPEPKVYAIMAERLGVRLEDCIMIDDREEYCLGAKGVGMQAILYTSFVDMQRSLDELLQEK